ncbi:MAG: D-2-hydroxyacid dehydrogenase [Xanthomonadales bacterium]|nr:D-2-hydroxyacid dehydrogenase [Xanthomonadales bacterium]
MLKNLLLCLLMTLPALAAAVETAAAPAAVEAMIERLGLREAATPSRELPRWKPPQKVLVRTDSAEWLKALRAVAPGVEIVAVKSSEAAIAEAADAQALIGFCDQEIFANAPQLHWVQVYSAGVERCVAHPGMQAGDKLLTNAQRIASPALADTAIALMMALTRGLDVYHSNQLQRDWDREIDMGSGELMELEGRTVLVVGLGGIGTQAAKRAHGLGMRVIATRNSRRSGPDYVDYVGLSDELLKLATQADVVINTVPLTDDTRGVFDAAFFAAMKPTAYFVSVGRGASTVTSDLVAALENGSIAGAGLDVTDPEPLPADHVLWTLPRVLITPHTAARSDKTRERIFLLVQENLGRYVAGEPMLSVVDIERGY